MGGYEVPEVFRELFDDYFFRFTGWDKAQAANAEIKRCHSQRVSELCLAIASSEGWDANDIVAAGIAGLFHDIGRFEQLQRYNTFNDDTSLDHAQLGAGILGQENMLATLPPETASRITEAIVWHNKVTLPEGLPHQAQNLAALLRDADKLDIMEVIVGYYEHPGRQANHTLTWEMPEGTSISAGVAQAIKAGQLVDKRFVKTQVDIKAMQLSWVFDLNYGYSFSRLTEREYLERIYRSFPKGAGAEDVFGTVKSFVVRRMVSFPEMMM